MQWFRRRFRRNGQGNLNSGKEKMKILGTRIYSSRTNSEEKGLLNDDEIRIRITLCLPSSNLIDDNRIWHATYSCWKRIKGDIAQNLRKSSWTTGRIEKNEWIKMIIKEKESCLTTVRIRKWLMKGTESPGRIRRTNMLEGI